MSLEPLAERIWNNWKNGEGACEGCNNRDCDGEYTPKNMDPGVTSGDPDPAVVYLGDCPGDGNNRSVKNSGSTEPVSSSLSEEIDGSWNPVMEALDSELTQFFEKTGYVPENGGRGFYTNAKKCADIENRDDANDDARSRCKQYLEIHIELLDPIVIVAFGNSPMHSLSEVFGFTRRGSGGQGQGITDEALQVLYDDQRPVIVPSIHWGRLWANLGDLPGEPSNEEYWDQLAANVREAL